MAALACNIENLGVFDVCEIVTTEILIPIPGTYFIRFEINGIEYNIEFEIESENDPVIIDMSELPAYREIIFKIFDENDDEVIFENISMFRIETSFAF